MMEQIDGMPDGVLGLRSTGKLSKADYTDVLAPALARAIDSGEVRLLYVLDGFDGLEPGAWIEDAKMGLNVWVRHHSVWRRFALVTDVEWVARATRTFAWVGPGESRVFAMGEEPAARDWVAG